MAQRGTRKSDWLDAKCAVKDDFYNVLQENFRLKMRDDNVPRWQILLGKDAYRHFLGEVACPCQKNNHTLSEDAALRAIVGQVAALGIDEVTAEMALVGSDKRQSVKGKRDNALLFTPETRRRHQKEPHRHLMKPMRWNAKVALATYQMISCWKAICYADEEDGLLDNSAGVRGGEQLSITQKCGGGAGWGARRR